LYAGVVRGGGSGRWGGDGESIYRRDQQVGGGTSGDGGADVGGQRWLGGDWAEAEEPGEPGAEERGWGWRASERKEVTGHLFPNPSPEVRDWRRGGQVVGPRPFTCLHVHPGHPSSPPTPPLA